MTKRSGGRRERKKNGTAEKNASIQKSTVDELPGTSDDAKGRAAAAVGDEPNVETGAASHTRRRNAAASGGEHNIGDNEKSERRSRRGGRR